MKRPRTTTMNASAGIGPTRLCIRTPPIDGKIGIQNYWNMLIIHIYTTTCV